MADGRSIWTYQWPPALGGKYEVLIFESRSLTRSFPILGSSLCGLLYGGGAIELIILEMAFDVDLLEFF